MMGELANHVRREASTQALEQARTRLGTISGYDATNFLAKVVLQPDGVESGWLPIGTIGVGSNAGVLVAPEIGQVVQVEFQDGGIDAGLITLRYHNDDARPPGAAAPGEVWVVHKSGTSVKLTADGKLTLRDAAGSVVALNNDGTITSSGTWIHTGNITASGTVTGTTDVVGGGKSLKTHVHSGVVAGAGTSGTPV